MDGDLSRLETKLACSNCRSGIFGTHLLVVAPSADATVLCYRIEKIIEDIGRETIKRL